MTSIIFEDEENCVCYTLHKEDLTAEISNSPNAFDDIIIPYLITYDSQEYIIKSISKMAFKGNPMITSVKFPENSEIEIIPEESFCSVQNLETINIPKHVKKIETRAISCCNELKSVNFSADSELISIDNSAFQFDRYLIIDLIPKSVKYIGENAFIQCNYFTLNLDDESELVSFENNFLSETVTNKIFIPKKVTQLKEKWCKDSDIKTVTVSPQNKSFKIVDDTFLVGKTNDDFDSIYFVFKNAEHVKIPSYIKYIKPYSFQKCESLVTIEFPPDSQLESFNNDFLNGTKVKSICIPKNVTEIENGWFCNATKLIHVSVFPENKYFKSIDGKMIVGKTADNCNSLYFVNRDVKQVTIPSYIKSIKQNALSYCSTLDEVKFEPDSQLAEIEDYGFAFSKVKSIVFPKSVTKIGKKVFYKSKFGKIEFEKNSQLYYIGKSAFKNATIDSIEIPDHVKTIQKGTFFACTIRKIIFTEDSELTSFEQKSISTYALAMLYIPPKLESFGDLCFWWNYNNFKEIIISPKNQCFKLVDNKLLVGKTKKESNDFDILYFALGNTENAIIPSDVKIIYHGAFCECPNLQTIEFQSDSQLTKICDSAFKHCQLKSIVLPKSVQIIEERAFYESNLESIEFSKDSNLELIDEYAFYRTNIKNISIPSSVKYIKKGAFHSCTNLEDVSIPEDSKLELIDEESFGETSIKKIIFPKKLKRIEQNAFYRCHFLETVIFSVNSELEFIGNHSFGRTNIHDITIPKHVNNIGAYAFRKCMNINSFDFEDDSELTVLGEIFSYSKINQLTIPQRIEKIEPYSLSFVDSISISPENQNFRLTDEKILIGKTFTNKFDALYYVKKDVKQIEVISSIRRIKSFAFNGCLQLEKVVFKNDSQLERIEKFAFKKSSIKHITIPKHVKSIYKHSFDDCDKLESIDFAVDSELEIIEKKACENSSLRSFSIPSGVKNILPYTFANYKQLETILIPGNSELATIDSYAFSSTLIKFLYIPDKVEVLNDFWCFETPNLKRINVSPRNKNFKIVDEKMLIGKSTKESDDFDSIYFVNRDADRVTIPANIKYLKTSAFQHCSNLETVEFEANSKLEKIEDHAFSFSNVHNLVLPKTVKVIGKKAFRDCGNLEEIEFSPDSQLEVIEMKAFQRSFIKKLMIPKNVKIIDVGAFSSCTNLDTIEFQENSQLEKICDKVFQGSLIKRFSLPKSVKEICFSSFCYCNNLLTIEFPEDSILELIEESAFSESGLEKVSFPKSLKKISSYSFNKCFMLCKVEFPEDSQLVSLGKKSFSETAIERFVVPRQLKSIETSSFEDCNKLKSFEFQENSEITSICPCAFYGSSLKSLIVPASVKKVEYCTFAEMSALVEFLADEIELEHPSEANDDMIFSFPNANKVLFTARCCELMDKNEIVIYVKTNAVIINDVNE